MQRRSAADRVGLPSNGNREGGGGGQVLLPLATVSSASTVVEEWRYAGGSDVNDVGASLGGIA